MTERDEFANMGPYRDPPRMSLSSEENLAPPHAPDVEEESNPGDGDPTGSRDRRSPQGANRWGDEGYIWDDEPSGPSEPPPPGTSASGAAAPPGSGPSRGPAASRFPPGWNGQDPNEFMQVIYELYHAPYRIY